MRPPESGSTDLWAVLARRRMCRDFLADPVEPAVIDEVVAAAARAPSAGNTAALDVVVLTGDGVQEYWDLTLSGARRDGFAWPGLLAAPVLVMAYVDPAAYLARYSEPDKVASGLGGSEEAWPVPYWWVDGGAAIMAVLLAAEAAGLGALFFGQFHHAAALVAHFGVPAGRQALGTVALGWPRPGGGNRSRSSARRRDDPQQRVHHGRW